MAKPVARNFETDTTPSRAVMKKATDVSASAQPADLMSCIFPTSGDRAAAPPGACRLPELPVLRTRGGRIRQLSKRKFTAHAGLVIPAEVQCSGRNFSALPGTSVVALEPQWSRWNLSLLFNLSCPVWHARCARWQCSDTWNCVRARYFVKDEDGYPLSRLPPGYLRRIGDERPKTPAPCLPGEDRALAPATSR